MSPDPSVARLDGGARPDHHTDHEDRQCQDRGEYRTFDATGDASRVQRDQQLHQDEHPHLQSAEPARRVRA